MLESDIDIFELLRNMINERLGNVLSDHRLTAEVLHKERETARIRESARKHTGRDIDVPREKQGD